MARNLRRSIKRLLIYPVYLPLKRTIMARSGLQPRGVFHLSQSGSNWTKEDFEDWIALPNLSGYYNGVLKRFFKRYGLGKECLLVSESTRIADLMAGYFPDTRFTTCDLFSELAGGDPNFVWDITQRAPAEIQARAFDSVICNAVLEHVIDPTAAIANQIELLAPGGHLFAMTHTPSFFYHPVPRDYVRFTHDYFEDLPAHMRRTRQLATDLKELWSCDGYINVCYARM